MSVTDFNYMSQALMHPTTVKIVLPDEGQPLLTILFLHGLMSDAKACLDHLSFQQLSDKYHTAFVIPDCGNSFYLDYGIPHGNFGKFVGSELVEVLREKKGLFQTREKSIIAGFSMGGYGAIRNGVKYLKNYSKIAAISSVCVYEPSADNENNRFAYIKRKIFEELYQKDGNPANHKNYRYLIQKAMEKGQEIPQIALYCGLEDELLESNKEFEGFLREYNINVHSEYTIGGHNWEYWNETLQKSCQWIEHCSKR